MSKKSKDLSVLRHSAAHLLAHAVSELFPETILTIGPATKEGFFYDFLPKKNFRQEDLAAIEQRMHELSEQNIPLTHRQISKDEARGYYKDNPFKLELIDMIPGDTVGLAEQGTFSDLCRGGHVESTGEIQYFKLLHISGSYWRADKDNVPLQRITGTAFLTQEDLDSFIKQREEAVQFDHRKLGQELDLFSFHQEGVGFPFFHPKGKTVLNVMTSFLRRLLQNNGYQEISTPTMLSEELWKQSGHYDHYKNNMFFCRVEDDTYAIKPMNCPGAILIYKTHPHSYRALPLRLSEFGLVHRFELSGVLMGLFRARAFTIDDGHIFCTEDQIEQEVFSTIEMIYKVLGAFGFENISIKLATKPDNAMGSDEYWEKAIAGLRSALDASGKAYEVCEGEGAFYGPKIEFHFQDSMGRSWQCGTVQLDFFLPQNFDLHYVASDGVKKRPVMIHRAIYGSFERFFGILLEHYKGILPFWIAPVQIRVLTITDDQKSYARDIVSVLQKDALRVELDESSDQISSQIKRAQLERIPWMLVIGKKEVENNTITVRYLDGKQEFGLSLDAVRAKARELVNV